MSTRRGPGLDPVTRGHWWRDQSMLDVSHTNDCFKTTQNNFRWSISHLLSAFSTLQSVLFAVLNFIPF